MELFGHLVVKLFADFINKINIIFYFRDKHVFTSKMGFKYTKNIQKVKYFKGLFYQKW